MRALAWARAWAVAQGRAALARARAAGAWALARARPPAAGALGGQDWRRQVGVECARCGRAPAPACPHFYATAAAAGAAPSALALRAAGVRRIWFAPAPGELVAVELDSGLVTLRTRSPAPPPEPDRLERGKVDLSALTAQAGEMRAPL